VVQYTISTFLDFAHYIVFKKEHTVSENTCPPNLLFFLNTRRWTKNRKPEPYLRLLTYDDLKSLKKGTTETEELLSEGCHGQ
jgi:hypothetical protein